MHSSIIIPPNSGGFVGIVIAQWLEHGGSSQHPGINSQ